MKTPKSQPIDNPLADLIYGIISPAKLKCIVIQIMLLGK